LLGLLFVVRPKVLSSRISLVALQHAAIGDGRCQSQTRDTLRRQTCTQLSTGTGTYVRYRSSPTVDFQASAARVYYSATRVRVLNFAYGSIEMFCRRKIMVRPFLGDKRLSQYPRFSRTSMYVPTHDTLVRT
jgi:hypothetical protein